jgi:hypothetical protein
MFNRTENSVDILVIFLKNTPSPVVRNPLLLSPPKQKIGNARHQPCGCFFMVLKTGSIRPLVSRSWRGEISQKFHTFLWWPDLDPPYPYISKFSLAWRYILIIPGFFLTDALEKCVTCIPWENFTAGTYAPPQNSFRFGIGQTVIASTLPSHASWVSNNPHASWSNVIKPAIHWISVLLGGDIGYLSQ